MTRTIRSKSSARLAAAMAAAALMVGALSACGENPERDCDEQEPAATGTVAVAPVAFSGKVGPRPAPRPAAPKGRSNAKGGHPKPKAPGGGTHPKVHVDSDCDD